MVMSDLFDVLWRGVGDAMADIRQRVVEEGWFGRPVTPNHSPAPPTDSPSLGWEMKRADFDAQWAPRERDTQTPEPGHDIHGHEMER